MSHLNDEMSETGNVSHSSIRVKWQGQWVVNELCVVSALMQLTSSSVILSSSRISPESHQRNVMEEVIESSERVFFL